MSLNSLSRRLSRAGRQAWLVSDRDLHNWAETRDLTLRQAFRAALQEGVLPEVYERNFPTLSPAEQLRLFDSSVLVAGLGGLGGAQALLLARTGVGRLLLADGDVFVPANLNRQLLATEGTLGLNKAQVTARHLLDLNPALEAEAIPYFLHADNLRRYLPQVLLILDALDTAAGRRHLFNAAREAGLPLVHGAVQGQFGQVATFLPADADAFARLYPDGAPAPEAGREVLASTVTLVASLQVQEALRLLLGQPPAYRGKLAHFDGDTGRLDIVELS
jgi:molybdopterin-synthase adenylyltransferase